MHRSSESIAALAGALAKAQCELTNPEKSLIGAIKAEEGGDTAERLFRYASLASGLDIVRKTLGQHEIATVQTTAIDQDAGIINLTTVLAHASGQWIASDWPVCAIADAEEPHRMGAALTYARRYALFTLVGIAGEDDLDAPDLIAPVGQGTGHGGKLRRGGSSPSLPRNGHAHQPNESRPSLRIQATPKPSLLQPQQSVSERDRLLGELAQVGSSEAAAIWARQTLPAKNSLTAADAQLVEQAFQSKLVGLGETDPIAVAASSSPSSVAGAQPSSRAGTGSNTPSTSLPDGIDKAELAFPEPRRIRDKDHLKFVARQPCLICGRSPSDPHHLRFAQSRALGRKASDEFTVPLCRGHHREVHRCGDESTWWKKSGIDPLPASRILWLKTHPQRARASQAVDGVAINGGGANRSKATRNRPQKNETKPISAGARQ